MAGRELDSGKNIKYQEYDGDVITWTATAEDCLKAKNWRGVAHYCNRVLEFDPENETVLLYKLMAKRMCVTKESLSEQEDPFDGDPIYEKLINFAPGELKTELEGYNAAIKARIPEKKRLADAYSVAVEHQEECTAESLEKAAAEFSALGEYGDSAVRADECLRLAAELKKLSSKSFFAKIKNKRKKSPFKIELGSLHVNEEFDKALLVDAVIPLSLDGKEVRSIADGAFIGCRNLKSISISSGKVTIGKDAFKGCPIQSADVHVSHISGIPKEKLKNLVLTSKSYGETIDKYVFKECKTLESVDMSACAGSVEIGWGAFENCVNLKSVKFPTGLRKLGMGAFRGCTSLTDMELPDDVKDIEYGVFAGCTGLLSIKLPANAESIAVDTLYHCTNLEKMEMANTDTGRYCVVDNCLIDRKENKLVKVCKNGRIPLQNSVKIIGKYAFAMLDGLRRIEFPASLEAKEKDTYFECTDLESIKAENGGKFFHAEGNCLIKTDEKLLVWGCKNSVIPTDGSVEKIGEGAFQGLTDIKAIKIPASIKSIDAKAFYKCNNIESIEVEKGNKVYHSMGNCLIKTDEKILVLGCKNSVIPDDGSVEHIGDYAFYECSNLKEIEIPDQVSDIGECAFRNCPSLVKVKLGQGLERIGCLAFSICEKLAEINIPRSLTVIDTAAFLLCRSLTELRLPSALKCVGYRAFNECTALQKLEFADSKGWQAVDDEKDWKNKRGGKPIDLRFSWECAEILKAEDFKKYLYK